MKGYRSKSGEKAYDIKVVKVKNLKELADKLPKARRNKSLTNEALPDMFHPTSTADQIEEKKPQQKLAKDPYNYGSLNYSRKNVKQEQNEVHEM